MKETIYLVCDQNQVDRMRKTLPSVRRGEIIVKLSVDINPKAFGRPTIAKEIYVDDWTKGIDLDDVEFRKNIITAEEAEMIRQKRLDKMREILQNQGYIITEPEEEKK